MQALLPLLISLATLVGLVVHCILDKKRFVRKDRP